MSSRIRDMRQDYEQLFTHLQAPEPTVGLFVRIVAAIRTEQRRLAVRRIARCSLVLVGSLVLLVPAWQMVQTGLAQSGFVEFFSLMFSDTGLMATFWQNFAMVLLESLPVTGLALFLLAMAGLLTSFRFIITQTIYDVA